MVDIASILPVSRPAVSQHLKVLKDAMLVTDRAEGTRRIYQVDSRGLAAVRRYFDRFWTDALDAFRQAAENERSHETSGAPRRRESTPNARPERDELP